MNINNCDDATDPLGPAAVRRRRRDGRDRLLACPAVAATLLAAIVLAGCGGSSSNARVAHIDTSNSRSSAPSKPSRSAVSGCSPSGCSSPAASASAEAIAVRYSACMRSHGLSDFPDPTLGSNGLPSWNLAGRGVSVQDPNSPQFQAANGACKNELPNLAPQTPTAKAAANAKALKYVVCMRSHGEPDFPDPNGQGLIHITNATGILDPNSPQYKKAQDACQSLDNGFAQSSSSSVRSGS